MKRPVIIILSMAIIFLMGNCSDNTIARQTYPPKPSKKMYSAKSSGPSAPVLIKDLAGNQSAKK